MKIRVRLLGLLPREVESYDAVRGLEVEMPEGATCGDVAVALDLPPARAGMFSVGGILKNKEEVLADGAELYIFMPLAGG